MEIDGKDITGHGRSGNRITAEIPMTERKRK